MTLLERLDRLNSTQETKSEENKLVDYSMELKKQDSFTELKMEIHKQVIQIYNDQIRSDGNEKDIDVKEIIERCLIDTNELLNKSRRDVLIQEIYDDVMGLGPIESLLRDDDISEIMVNGKDNIYIEKKGKLELSPVIFRDDAHVIQIINRIVSPIGRRCDEATPMVDARLPNGSRVNAIVPPVALSGPTITIRKFKKDPLRIKDLISFNSLSVNMAEFLEACVAGRCNVMVSGGTGSGKTTLLNVLSSFIPDSERIVTIEDAAELQLMQNHVVILESRPPNIEGKGSVTIRDVVKNSLRMRPDRIIIGEVRSGEALDMLQAMNTGHDGSIATAHANSARDMISRLETMVMMSGMDLPVRAIREQIASAIHIIVQQTRLKDGSRKIIAISEVTGMEGDIVTLQDIFMFNQEGVDLSGKVQGSFVATGIRPYIVETLKTQGVKIDDRWFVKI